MQCLASLSTTLLQTTSCRSHDCSLRVSMNVNAQDEFVVFIAYQFMLESHDPRSVCLISI
jgi:hypothetical protein